MARGGRTASSLPKLARGKTALPAITRRIRGGGTVARGVRHSGRRGHAPLRRLSAELLAIAKLAGAMRATSELALEACQQGIAFLSAVRKAWPHPELERLAAALREAGITPMLPIAAGMVCAVHDIALNLALPLYPPRRGREFDQCGG